MKREDIIKTIIQNQANYSKNLNETQLPKDFDFSKVLLPIIRRSYPSVMASQIFSTWDIGGASYSGLEGRGDFELT